MDEFFKSLQHVLDILLTSKNTHQIIYIQRFMVIFLSSLINNDLEQKTQNESISYLILVIILSIALNFFYIFIILFYKRNQIQIQI